MYCCSDEIYAYVTCNGVLRVMLPDKVFGDGWVDEWVDEWKGSTAALFANWVTLNRATGFIRGLDIY
jgi:hypothetical protein